MWSKFYPCAWEPIIRVDKGKCLGSVLSPPSTVDQKKGRGEGQRSVNNLPPYMEISKSILRFTPTVGFDRFPLRRLPHLGPTDGSRVTGG